MPLNKHIKGYFWDSNHPELRQYGELTISDDNSIILLSVKGFLKPFSSILLNINYHDKIPLILGFSMDGEWLTVGGLRVRNIVGAITLDPIHSKTTVVELDADYLIVSAKEKSFESLNTVRKVAVSPQFSNKFEEESTIECDFSADNIFSPTLLTEDGEYLTYKLRSSKPIEIPFEQGSCVFKTDYLSLPFHPQDQLNIKKEYDFVFDLDNPLDISEIIIFLKKIREVFSLLVGTYIALEAIKVWSVSAYYTLYFKGNKRNVYYPSGIGIDHRVANLHTIVNLNILNNFLSNYNFIKLPLRHYFDFIESEKDMPHQELLLLISALEVTFNRIFKIKESRIDEYPRVVKEILELDCLTKHQKDFLKNYKKGTRVRTFKIKDKIFKLIEDSVSLVELIKNPDVFVEEILEVRHYIVHEANPSTLDLYNNEIKLQRYNMKLKIILEYYLLMSLGFDKEYLDAKINRTLVNLAQFRN